MADRGPHRCVTPNCDSDHHRCHCGFEWDDDVPDDDMTELINELEAM